MKNFFKTNKSIFIILIIALIYVILYLLFNKKITNIKIQYINLLDLIYQISVGYIISFIFYLMQVYIPRIQQNKIAYNSLKIRLCDTVEQMKGIFRHIAPIYIDSVDIETLTDEQILLIFKHLDLSKRIDSIIKANLCGTSEQYFTIQEFIYFKISNVTLEIDKIFNYYTSYISPELTIILEKILKSRLHSIFITFLQSPNRISFETATEDPFLTEYYKLMKELTEYTNNIY